MELALVKGKKVEKGGVGGEREKAERGWYLREESISQVKTT